MKKILILFLLTDKFLCVNNSEIMKIANLDSLQELSFNKSETEGGVQSESLSLQEELEKKKEISEKVTVLQDHLTERLKLNKGSKNLALILNGSSIVAPELCNFENIFDSSKMQRAMQMKRITYYGHLERFLSSCFAIVEMELTKQKKKPIALNKEFIARLQEYVVIPNASELWDKRNDIKAIGLRDGRLPYYTQRIINYLEHKNLTAGNRMALGALNFGQAIALEYIDPKPSELNKFTTSEEFIQYIVDLRKITMDLEKKKNYIYSIPFSIVEFRKALINANQQASFLSMSSWLDSSEVEEVNENSKTVELSNKFTQWLLKSGKANQAELNEQRQIGNINIREMMKDIKDKDLFIFTESDMKKLENFAMNYLITSKKITVDAWNGNEFKKSSTNFEINSNFNKMSMQEQLTNTIGFLHTLDSFTFKSNSNDVGNSKLGEIRFELFKDEYSGLDNIFELARSVVSQDSSMEATLIEFISSVKSLIPDNYRRNLFKTINKNFIINIFEAFASRYAAKFIQKTLPKNLIIKENPGQRFIAFREQHLPFEPSQGKSSGYEFVKYEFHGEMAPAGKLGIHSGPGMGKTTATQAFALNAIMFETFKNTPWAKEVTIDPNGKHIAWPIFLKNKGELQQRSTGIQLSGYQSNRMKTERLMSYISLSGERAIIFFDEVFSSGDNKAAAKQMEQSDLQELLMKDQIAIVSIEHNKTVLEENSNRTIAFDLIMSSSASDNSAFKIDSVNLTPRKIVVEGEKFRAVESYLAGLETRKVSEQVIHLHFKIKIDKDGKKLIPLDENTYKKIMAKTPSECVAFSYSIKNEVILKENYDDGIGGKGIVYINPIIAEFQLRGDEGAAIITMTMNQTADGFEFKPEDKPMHWELKREMCLENKGFKEISGFASEEYVLPVVSVNPTIIKLFSDKINQKSEENIRKYFQSKEE